MSLAALYAGIHGQRLHQLRIIDETNQAQSWLDSFNHRSVEPLPFYTKALESDDPLIPLRHQLVAGVEKTQKLIESMPNRNRTKVSIVEVATMNPSCYRYSIHVPKGRRATLAFYAVDKSNNGFENRAIDSDFVFTDPELIDVPIGLSRLEVAIESIEEKSERGVGRRKAIFVEFIPKVIIRIDGKVIFEELIPNYRQVGSNLGWKPESKQQIVLNKSSTKAFSTFYFSEAIAHNTLYGGIQRPGKSYSVKFDLKVLGESDGEATNE